MNIKWLYYSAAGTTVIAGILHLILAPNMLNFNPSSAILFLVGGAAQLFWVVPMIRRWGRVWYGICIGGTLVLIAIWMITRIDGNPITGRGGMINEMGIAVETMQWAFVGLTAAILVMELRMKRIDKGAGPSGLAVISLQKADSLLVFLNVQGAKKISAT